MSKINNKKIYKKIKHSALWANIAIFLIFAIVTIVVLVISINQSLRYVIDSKMGAEYENIHSVSMLFEEEIENSGKTIDELFIGDNGTVLGKKAEKLIKTLNTQKRNYIITDKDDNVLYLNGEDTRDNKVEKLVLNYDAEEVSIYTDKDAKYLYVDKSGELLIDIDMLFEWLTNNKTQKELLSHPSEAEFFDMLKLPLWIVADIKGGEYKFIGRAEITLNTGDIMLFVKIVVVLTLLVFLILISMLISAVVSVIRQKKIINYFFTDPETGGHNRMYYLIKGEQQVKSFLNRNKCYALVNLVFVNYRNFVVCHSLAEGEKLLRNIYAYLGKSINRKEICAHTDGSNFALLLEFDNEDRLKERIDKLVSELEYIDKDHKFAFQLGVSLIKGNDDEKADIIRESGQPEEKAVTSEQDKKNKADNQDSEKVIIDTSSLVTTYRRKYLSFEAEYSNACTAGTILAESDESGVSYFDEKIVEDQRWLDTVQERQRSAVDNEEFLIYYQPKYNPKTNELKGAEALIRWQSPDLGFVTPFKFIPIFEKNGFITEIDHYMISHVARDQKRWLDEGYKCVPVSVNVSRAHFIESDLAEQIRNMVDDAECPRELIEIELTESAFFDDKKTMIETINKLKSYGFSVSMDDFGAGYSSLNSLKDMPLDVLKLDAEFFRGESDGRGRIVVSEAIRLARKLNMKTVAEGIEIKEQIDFLAEEGCDMIQGYYYAKPMPGAEYEERMQS
ncbi:MAG: GGDEF domain-containing phosphodiesterase [Lachnospiraceae bacterium]|nr:GGDEF domain-containing phosphodiesterase [Lachnospiraceae bacterium]